MNGMRCAGFKDETRYWEDIKKIQDRLGLVVPGGVEPPTLGL